MPRTNEQFEEDFKSCIEWSKDMLIKKGKEYTVDGDRLGQFYKAGAVQSVNPAAALVGMMTKHFVSVCDMSKNPTNYSMDMWEEKLGDLRNYTILLESLINDLWIQEGDNK